LSKDLLNAISKKSPEFSKGQKLIADFIINHYDQAAFMTAAKLGAFVGVSESTVVRFANEVGFDGYPSLQREIQELIRNKLTFLQRLQITNKQIGSGEVLDKVLNLDIEKIRVTLEETSRSDFNNAVDTIVNSKNIYIIGSRSASALARFLAYYFGLVFENVKLVHTTSSSEMFEQILRINKGDVIIGISFPRYSNLTIQAFDFASKRGGSVVAITDSKRSPIALKADHILLAQSDMVSFVDSLVAPLSLINALIVSVGLKKSKDIEKTFERLEGIWEEYDVYKKMVGDDE
jgi:DNA-binding MurR/RpiR family transcriptional regulator